MNSVVPAVEDTVTGSYLTFALLDARYALAVRHIRYITSLAAIAPREVPDTEHQNHRVFQFQDAQIPLYPFCDLVGMSSQQEDCQELIALLAQRRQDHIDWMDALHASIREGVEFTKATDPHQCAFGLWYDHYAPEDDELKEIMMLFDEPHKRIHALAEKLLDVSQRQGQVDVAIGMLEEEKHSTLRQLMNLFEQASERLREMQKPVVVILNTGHRTFAIELDGIDGIIDFEYEHWLADTDVDKRPHCYDGFFQKPGAELFVKLNPFNLLTA